ncbi:50S ribosomal protein L7/L12-serine acetyltransferase [Pectobacterium odoriferum]|uniref:50S ribosomal protein L7/L12-serine acetyltransferase n=1 Tax=Pectobacterium odoriferum TaxID=78398 RepID=UPI0032EB7565
MAQKITPVHVTDAVQMILDSGVDSEQPFFIFDADSACLKARELAATCKKYFTHVDIAVSLKSCSLGLFCKLMAEEGFSAEACSSDEIHLAIAAGFPSERIILDGPLKLSSELAFAINKGILIQVDSLEELVRLENIAAQQGHRCGIGLRLSHYYDEENRSRFGITEEEYLKDIYPRLSASRHLYLAGFHLHVGSNLSEPDKITNNLNEWLPFLLRHMPEEGHLDLGSGFPADSFSSNAGKETPHPESFFSAIHDLLNLHTKETYKKWKIIFEPGRYLSEDSGYLCGSVFGSKWRYGAEVIQTNLGINWIPSIHNWHHSLTVLNDGDGHDDEHPQIVAGYNCFENDCLFPRGHHGFMQGKHFLIRGCGSYDLQTGNEWTRRKPVVYALLNGSVVVARSQSSKLASVSNDLLHRGEIIPIHKNLKLVTPSRHYASALYQVINENRDYFSQYMAWPRYVTAENDTATFLDECLLSHQKNEGKTYVILSADTPVGLLSFNSIDASNKTAYIGYWLGMNAQGKGIMTCALNALVEHYFSEGKIKRFVIKCATGNKASNNVAKRCGFQFEGVLRKAEIINGESHDQNIYSWIGPLVEK